MQPIILEKPYRFVPPHTGRIWPWLIVLYLDRFMRKNYGVRSYQCRDIDKLARSLDAGHGVLVVGNHSRPCDPMACGWLTREAHHPMYCMASWHVFANSRFESWMIRHCGAFSVYREGTDHKSLNFAVQSLVKPDRPVVIFAEGSVTRSNDHVRPLLDGAAVIARMAARRRAKADPPGRVVVHPVAFKYFFRGDLEASVTPVLERIEQRLDWQPQTHRSLLDRIRKLGNALLCLRELEYLGQPRGGAKNAPRTHDRIEYLMDHVLESLDREYAPNEGSAGGIYARVQRLRSRILPDMIEGKVSEEERQRRWRQLRDCYVVQQLACYPRNYLGQAPSAERMLETVERLEEDLTDSATAHGPLDLVMQVGDVIEVQARRDRGAREDPLMAEIKTSLSGMIENMGQNPP